MFAGKTTRLQSMVKDELTLGKRVVVVNHSSDQRYSTDNYCVSHTKYFLYSNPSSEKIPATKVPKLADMPSECIEQAEVIAIDEGQFFPDVRIFLLKNS